MKYASQTSVSVEKSRGEIERTLSRYGATKFAFYNEESKACIAFEISGKRIRFLLPLPSPRADEFRLGRYHRTRPDTQRLKLWEQACRQRWRALALAIKFSVEIGRAVKRAGLENLRLHDLRHSFATSLREAGVGIDVISKLLGHSDIRMTMRYAHIGNKQLDDAVDLIEGKFGGRVN